MLCDRQWASQMHVSGQQMMDYKMRERDTMDRSRGVNAAPEVQVRQLTQPTRTKKKKKKRDNWETLHIGKAPHRDVRR